MRLILLHSIQFCFTKYGRFIVLAAVLGWIVFPCCGNAAVVKTTRGIHKGRVVVHESTDRIIVTILTQDKRLFQFYAKDIESITAEEKILIGKPASLVSEPSPALQADSILTRGQEVVLVEKKTTKSPKDAVPTKDIADSQGIDWVQVKVGEGVTGWIDADCLTDSVIFTPEEKSIPLQKDMASDQVPSSTSELPSSATLPKEASG